MKTNLIFGATSAIAQKVAQKLAQRNERLLLIGRNEEKLQVIADDLTARGANQVDFALIDLAEVDQIPQQIEAFLQFKKIEHIDRVLIAHGTLPDQADIADSWQKTDQALRENGTSVIAILATLAEKLEQQKSGQIAVISSVAGDRGRQSNYVYGSAKALVTAYCQGLRNRLAKSNVQLLTIKPGFVDTPMTAAIAKGGPLWAKPEQVADDILNGLDKGKNEIYTLWFWRFIMMIIKYIPEPIFKRLSL
ncbi:SDR family oxidoreductase [Pelagibaculum spongiae]|uniref:Short-chain dehydrogenase n=1 Tax=Pelagibaculum spongiae TaxID=2080658 RepID=A0A2V1GVF6_9GAMM|nr:SDR family oxidoreductase [Pelagibaculum spongiae]PVZ68923.1 short-chain dehydrogenase [Pelagibaculum spongiae]